MSWWALVPDALALALLAVVPGALALRVLGVRGLAGLAAAPPVTVAALGVLSVLLARFGVAWRLPAVLACLALVLAVVGGLAWLVTRRRATTDDGAWRPGPLGTRRALAVAAGTVAGVVLLAGPFVATLPTPDAPLQQWDAVFHLNAVVAARETGVVTPLGGLAPLYGDGTLAPYYPTGWHALVALAPGASVPAATNAGVLVLGTGAWVLGLAGLAREVFRRRTLPAVLAPLLAAGFVAYPVVQLTVLAQLANGLSTALLPGAVLLVLRAVRAVQARAGGPAVAGTVVAAAAGVGGVVVAHASGLFSLALVAGPLVVGALGGQAVRLVRAGRRAAGGALLAAVTAAVVAVPVVLANLDALSSVVGFERASGRSHTAALREVLLDQTLAHGYPGDGRAHLAVTAATLVGALLVVLHRRHRWLAAALVLTVALAVLAAGPADHPLRWLASFWYTQAGRIAPVAVVPAVLLAAYALTTAVDAVRRRVPARAAGHAALAVVLALAVGTAVARLPLQARVVASAYVPGELAWGTMATAEELTMMRELDLPAGAVVVGDPFNGSALLPAVAGVGVVFPQLGASGMSPAQRVLQEGLADIHDDPAVCAALADAGATHLYQDTATAEAGAKLDDRTAAMRGVDVSEGFTEVARAGTAAVHRIDTCP
ncbi:DUF6541 family protein [Oceanitalea stevensii]|uniref:Glycosyltransferase RgtA/B/C/D-like domain-containing protein n=1 Tax=Oceanitalea stevensii TaxID=2763072 RepID=A0ABR8Z464_9MICO|nr:DUF6541 family protein [Oceanitalea stevensii]MBD8063110.1 hypothetical protein [Oceanitalea stevensii]